MRRKNSAHGFWTAGRSFTTPVKGFGRAFEWPVKAMPARQSTAACEFLAPRDANKGASASLKRKVERMSAPHRHTPEAHEAQWLNVRSVMARSRAARALPTLCHGTQPTDSIGVACPSTARVPFLIARVRLVLIVRRLARGRRAPRELEAPPSSCRRRRSLTRPRGTNLMPGVPWVMYPC